MEPTPIPQTSYEALGAGSHRSAWGTWFETAHRYSVMNSTYEASLCWIPNLPQYECSHAISHSMALTFLLHAYVCNAA